METNCSLSIVLATSVALWLLLYLTETERRQRSLVPPAIMLATSVAFWLLFYVSLAGPTPKTPPVLALAWHGETR